MTWNLDGDQINYSGGVSTLCRSQYGSQFAQSLLCTELTATHPSGTLAGQAIVKNITGSGIYGPSYADYGLAVEETKHCYIATAPGCSSYNTTNGEIDVINFNAWQGVQGDGGGGQIVAMKARTGITASFTGTISGGTTLTVSGVTGTIAIGEALFGAGLPAPGNPSAPVITGGSGTVWTVSPTQSNVGPESMNASIDGGGVAAMGDLVGEWVLASTGADQWENHVLISLGEAAGGASNTTCATLCTGGYGVWTESWLGKPYAAYQVSTFNAYSGAGGTYGYEYAFAAWNDRSTANQYFSIAGDQIGSVPGFAEQPGDINQGLPAYSINLHTDGSGNWGVRFGATYELEIGSTGIVFVNQLNIANVLGLTPVAIASLSTCNSGAKGEVAFVSDTTASGAAAFHGTVTGSGATTVNSPVSCNGSNWQYD